VEMAREVVRQVGSRQTLMPRAARLTLRRQRPGQTPHPAASTLTATASTAGPPRRRTPTTAPVSRRPRPSTLTAWPRAGE
jgi:hypothetical protein